jgi:hypothetical protein
MDDNEGCLIFVVLACVLIVAYVLYTNGKIVIEMPVRPPEESWEAVYPKFRDDVSSQLLNTQKLVGRVIDDSSYIKSQNADIQYSMEILFSELGIIQKKAAQESRRQRTEQWIATGLSVALGWLLAAFIPTDKAFKKLRNIFAASSKRDRRSRRDVGPKPDVSEHYGLSNDTEMASDTNISFWKFILIRPSLLLIALVVFLLSVTVIMLAASEYIF